MKPFIKWPGGKTEELGIILKNIPDNIKDYYEPFVGGGAVYFGIDKVRSYYINDKSDELMSLYKAIKEQNKAFLYAIYEINKCWKILEIITEKHIDDFIDIYNAYKKNIIDSEELAFKIKDFILKNSKEFNGILDENFIIDGIRILKELEKNISRKMKRMKSLEQKKGELSVEDVKVNIETAFKSGLYTHFRFLYNNSSRIHLDPDFRTAIFYFIREYCYSSMFRYNRNGEFNVPYGGISYNKKYLDKKLSYIQSEKIIDRLDNTKMFSLDFEYFLEENTPNRNDFIFLDPPYDSSFSTYANNEFLGFDHERLSLFCKNTTANFMLIIKNTDFIYELYKNFYMKSFDKKYLVSFQNRNDKNAEHLLITNYEIKE